MTFLVRPGGTPMAGLQEMDGLLQDAWQPMNRKYAADPEPDPVAFLRRYMCHVRRVPVLAPPPHFNMMCLPIRHRDITSS